MRRFAVILLIFCLAGLVWFSLHLAMMRIYQVDECTEVYVARLVAAGAANSATSHVTLFQVMLSPFVRGFTQSADLFTSARFVMIEIFWLNLILIAVATGEKLLSLRGLLALLGAATLAPLWDYGIEIRHDNLLLAGLLIMWCTIRLKPPGIQSFFIVGALAVGLEFVAFKSFIYTIPISFGTLLFPPAGGKNTRGKCLLAWTVGALAAFLVIRLALGALGLWQLYLAGDQSLSAASAGGHRFWPWRTLERLLGQTPLLLALVLAALITVWWDVKRRGKNALGWAGVFPETILFLIALGALLINPAPFPYNLLFLAPFMFLLAFRFSAPLVQLFQQKSLLPIVVGILCFAHFVPFAIATLRHLKWPNYRQVRLMYIAEKMTAPGKDAIFDGVTMVAARPVDWRWGLHSFSIANYLDGSGPHVRDLLAENPPPVFIPNYRTDWLADEDHAFVREHYVSLADDLWVLGKVLPPGGGTFEIIHAGRYRISSLEGSDIIGTYPEGMQAVLTPLVNGKINATLDGITFSNQPVELTVGHHTVECSSNCQPTVVWVGPNLERPGRQIGGDHHYLFYNWY